VGFESDAEQFVMAFIPQSAEEFSFAFQSLVFFESGRIMSRYMFDNVPSDVCKVVLRTEE